MCIRDRLKGAVLSPEGAIVPGDIITAVNGKPVDSLAKLLALLDDHRVGETVKLEVLRKGRLAEVAVVLQPGV